MPEPVNKRKDLLGFPTSYAFVIGINNYPKINAPLRSAVNDARALAKVLKQRQGFDHVELLVEVEPAADEVSRDQQRDQLAQGLDGITLHYQADAATLRELLARIKDPAREPRIQPGDCIVFYYAGHGKPGEFDEGPAGYLLPSDTRPQLAQLENDSLLPMEAVFETLKVLNCHHTLLILDCCFAGKFRQASQSRAAHWIANLPLYEERFERYKRERAWQVLVSAGPHQTAADWLGRRQELTADTHSPFAAALLEALEGKAELRAAGKKTGDGVLTSQELFLYLWDTVERLTNTGRLGKNSQYPDLFPMSNHQGGQFIFFDPNNKLNFAKRIVRNPYQGLLPFSTAAHDLFFGRKAVIDTLLTRLQEQSLIVITAPSSSGKSSLVRAGLYPAFTNWRNDAGEQPYAAAELLCFRPGTKPWTGKRQVTTAEATDSPVVYTGLQELLRQLKPDRPQILLLDQYEELFTEQVSPEERAAFEQALIQLRKKAANEQTWLILTLRADFEWMLEASAFGQSFWQSEEIRDFLYRLPGMRPDELRQALVNPALAELYEFESDELVEIILAEIGDAPGALPMLSFTMSQFYEATDKDTRVFTLPVYQSLGGVNGALSKYADAIYEALPDDEQRVMQRLLIRMLKVDNERYGRRRVYTRPAGNFLGQHGRAFLDEFDYLDTQDATVSKVLAHLADKQLIMAGKDRIGTYYVPVHDALIQHWKKARQWVQTFGAENIKLQRQLWQAVLDSSQSQDSALTYTPPVPPGAAPGKEELISHFSKLWDSNPKLLQILEQVSHAARDYVLNHKDQILEDALPHIDPEEQENFRRSWEGCLTKGELPDLNTLILSGYSGQLLSLFLEHGDHWLNQAETVFVRQSWDKRIEQLMELKAQKERVIHEMMSASWRASTFLDEDDFGYYKGVRDTYNNVKVLMDVKKIQSIAPVPLFLQGPHQEDFVNDSDDFAHYNPAFLQWLKKYAIPAERDSVLRRLTMPFYVRLMQVHVRNFYNVYKYHEKNSHILPQLAAAYQQEVKAGGERNTFQFYQQNSGTPPTSPVEIPGERQLKDQLFVRVASAFWLRRTLDGTIAHFREILVKLLQTYDPEWLQATDKIWDSPEAYRAEVAARNKAAVKAITQAVQQANQDTASSPAPGRTLLSGLYTALKPLLSVQQLQKLAPHPIFIGGPHGDTLNLQSPDEFGQYNPEFLQWVKEHAFPFKENRALGKVTKAFYEGQARDLARIHHWACTYWENNELEKQEIIKLYRSTIKDLKSSGYKASAWKEVEYGTPLNSILRTDMDSRQYTAMGFWIRRHMDGTAHLFKDMLLDVLQTYDAKWLAAAEGGAG